MENHGAEKNKLDRREPAGREEGEAWQLPEEMGIWGRRRRGKGGLRKLCSQIRFAVSILWLPETFSEINLRLLSMPPEVDPGLIWESTLCNWSQIRC